MYFKCHVGLDFASSCRVKATTKTNIYDRNRNDNNVDDDDNDESAK